MIPSLSFSLPFPFISFSLFLFYPTNFLISTVSIYILSSSFLISISYITVLRILSLGTFSCFGFLLPLVYFCINYWISFPFSKSLSWLIMLMISYSKFLIIADSKTIIFLILSNILLVLSSSWVCRILR